LSPRSRHRSLGSILIARSDRGVCAILLGDDPDVLVAAANGVGLDGAAIRARSVSDEIKARLRASTGELVARGGYGSPTLFVDGGDMYFGNDQLPLVEFALRGRR